MYRDWNSGIADDFPAILRICFSCLNKVHIIRIYHECEGRVEKYIPRITVWHHEACEVMTNSDSEERIFLSYPHTNNGFFFLPTTVLYIYLFIYFKIS